MQFAQRPAQFRGKTRIHNHRATDKCRDNATVAGASRNAFYLPLWNSDVGRFYRSDIKRKKRRRSRVLLCAPVCREIVFIQSSRHRLADSTAEGKNADNISKLKIRLVIMRAQNDETR